MPTPQDTYLERLEALQKRLDDRLARLASQGEPAAAHRAEGEKLQHQRARLHSRLGNAEDDRSHAATSDLGSELHELSKTADNWIKSIDQGFYR